MEAIPQQKIVHSRSHILKQPNDFSQNSGPQPFWLHTLAAAMAASGGGGDGFTHATLSHATLS